MLPKVTHFEPPGALANDYTFVRLSAGVSAPVADIATIN